MQKTSAGLSVGGLGSAHLRSRLPVGPKSGSLGSYEVALSPAGSLLPGTAHHRLPSHAFIRGRPAVRGAILHYLERNSAVSNQMQTSSNSSDELPVLWWLREARYCRASLHSHLFKNVLLPHIVLFVHVRLE